MMVMLVKILVLNHPTGMLLEMLFTDLPGTMQQTISVSDLAC